MADFGAAVHSGSSFHAGSTESGKRCPGRAIAPIRRDELGQHPIHAAIGVRAFAADRRRIAYAGYPDFTPEPSLLAGRAMGADLAIASRALRRG